MASKNTFSAPDYVILCFMLCVSAGIGVYYALTGGKQRTSGEFLMANRKLPMIPVALSLLASFMSGITYLGVPADVYFNGTMFWWFSVSHVISCFIAGRTFIPVFYHIGLTSVYEYLELRFNKLVRRCGLVSFYTISFLYLGIVIYAPCLAFSAVTGLSFIGSLFAVGIVCIFYTTIGGMKAVVWADVFQMTVAFCGFIAIIVKGSIDHNGFQGIWNISQQGNRIELLNLDPDPTVRHTLWSVVIGGTFLYTNMHGLVQYQVQRFLSCQSLKSCYGALFLYAVGLATITILSCMCGLVSYAYYYDCDPYTAGEISRSDQILPYLVVDIFGNIPGLSGLFLSAVFSAALSTLSSALNGLAAVTGEDVVKSIWPNIGEERYTLTVKFLASFFGICVIGLAFLADALGKIAQTAMAIGGVLGGPNFGMFSLGMFFPRANAKGALAGFCAGITIGLWIIIGSLIYPPVSQPLPLSTDGCPDAPYPINYTDTSASTLVTTDVLEVTTTVTLQFDDIESKRPAIASLYSVSYVWYSMITSITTILTGIIVSLLTGPTSPPDQNLVSPLCKSFCCCFSSKGGYGIQSCGKAKKSVMIDDSYWPDLQRDPETMEPLTYVRGDLKETRV